MNYHHIIQQLSLSIGLFLIHSIHAELLETDLSSIEKEQIAFYSCFSKKGSQKDCAYPKGPRRKQKNDKTATETAFSHFDLRGDFIYWYSNQSGMAYTTHPQSTFTTSDFSNGSLVNPSYDWEPGFRIDASYRFNQPSWSLSADFIWYKGKGDGSESSTSLQGIFPALSFADNTLPTDYVNQASMNWKLYTMLLDALALYEWNCTSYFKLISSFGLRNAWLSEKVNAYYEGGTYEAGADVVHLKSNFYGLGPRLAICPKFLLGKGFSYYAEGSGTMLGGWFHIQQSETFLNATRAKLNEHISKIRWEIDATTGFIYTYDLSEKKNLSFDLGFDYYLFFHQKEFIHGSGFDLQSQGTSLTLYGGHAAIGFGF